ncbi:tetratricopeptide repeat protein [Stigmatella aurantiaca]|uniref:Tetratricopeptide repeat domain protein n=1 Tax=Stigmatella aurantiaca (strain DW4/3-1) TaxID=378806 RepID=Q09CR0_STIAD|nr:tetratricopeptide repeat protein [Stigmatella aurantiaca]ADO70067.1 Tetratricopeptide repeat domain protein [Stigmatella aurantiaca DW4/3-1]EAU69511.1 tetratricopeptide repeat domain protein [Stigmatella aurantiaca DW4/3-1]
MDVRCERCKSQYQLEDSRISEAGLTVQCTTCQYVFVVKKKALLVTLPVKPGQESSSPAVLLGSTSPASAAPPEEPPEPNLPPPSGAGERGREWRVRQASGNVFSLKDLTTLQKWIIERKVVRDDEISLTGESWKRLGDIAELATFFQVLDEAQRASLLQAQVELGKALGTPASGGSARAGPVSAGGLGTSPRAPVAMRRGSPLPLLLVFLLVAVGAFFYFQVFIPQREDAARREEAQRVEALKEEEARQARLLAEKAAAEAAPPSVEDAGGENDPAADGGVPAAGGPLDTSDAGDAGAPEDAGDPSDAGVLPDAGGTADAGGDLDGGVPAVKRPEPVRDYNYYMAQGRRLRERERFAAAVDAYGQAAELAPDRAEPYAGRGLALMDLGNPQQAAAEFQQALQLNPRYGEAIIGLAETYRSQGKKAEAVRYYQRYLEILPEGPEAEVARSAIDRLME